MAQVIPMQFNLEMRISISQEPPSYQGRIEICETVRVQAKDFMELCAILGNFHSLAEKIKEIHGQEKR